MCLPGDLGTKKNYAIEHARAGLGWSFMHVATACGTSPLGRRSGVGWYTKREPSARSVLRCRRGSRVEGLSRRVC